MGTPLTGSSVASTYTGLLKNSDNSTVGASLKAISDGSGNDSALQVSNAAVNTTGDFSVATNKLTVASASGNTAVAGTLAVTGATNLSSLITSGAATIGGALNVTGATTLTGNLTIPGNLAVTGTSTLTGATAVTGTLGVAGASTLASVGVTGAATVGTTLGVTGATTLASVGVTGAATVGTTLGVTGATTLASLGVTGATTVGTTLGVTGNTTLTGDLAANGNTTLGNAGTDTLTLNSDNITAPNISTVTVDLTNDKVLISDASDSNKVKVVTVGSIGINASNAPQCVQQVSDDRITYTGGLTAPGTEIATLTKTITPRSTGSKVLVSIVLNYSCVTNTSQLVLFRLTRNGTEIGTSVGAGQKGIASGSYEDGEVNAVNNTKIEFFDSPNSSSAVTYKINVFSPLGATNLYLNYAINGGASFTTISTMTLQEFFA
jgi:hypothetical protein